MIKTKNNIKTNYTKNLEVKNKESENLSFDLQIEDQQSNIYPSIIDVLPDTLFLYDIEGNYLKCLSNDESKFSTKELIGKNLQEIMPENVDVKALRSILSNLTYGSVEIFHYDLTENDEKQCYEIRIVKYSKMQVLSIVRNITSQKKEQELFSELSFKDHLTGLYNRRYFEQYLKEIDSEEYLPVSLLMIDVNGLKLTNDAFGHLVGDTLLQRISTILKSVCPKESIVSRIGGDEFVVVLTKFSYKESKQLVDKIYTYMEDERINNVVVSISVGWETKKSAEYSIHDIFAKAENHMFRKKLVESQSMRNQTIKAIIETLNTKNEREKNHSEQVSILSRRIGEVMGFKSRIIKKIEIAGLLHDIGKIAVREEVLNKPSKLTDDEYAEVKKHAESGYQILKSVDAYSGLADFILAHHERYDGKGYPQGLIGEDIPLIARIIAVADAYEAMVSDRPYRKGISHNLAIEEVKRNAGTQFDPQIVNHFLTIFG